MSRRRRTEPQFAVGTRVRFEGAGGVIESVSTSTIGGTHYIISWDSDRQGSWGEWRVAQMVEEAERHERKAEAHPETHRRTVTSHD